ncbi:hypothetical protein ACLBX9_06115 [Methylobacterium sp. A49B]|uniref:Uncharacterized protein n=1 Tax=Methylobacterium mesophilicum SR1.6/6 TaxID=908290 RepID=A0A6B9FPK8_9HYPH|nr:hypothetical protein [Methylobacterium mesophilicum]QGY04541.1 hypothetical protein MMSR116_23470 [Methylobacterium mesophilicum SR1.6/6]
MRGVRRLGCAAALALCALCALPAAAEVRFGPGVRIGGHDFSNRRYGSVHIERVKRLRGPLGCRRLRHGVYRRGDGSVVRGPMEACNLVARPH